jgi:hypothetical protein
LIEEVLEGRGQEILEKPFTPKGAAPKPLGDPFDPAIH